MDMFRSGHSQTLENILANKEEREQIKHSLLAKFPDKTVISITINIPGDIKNNQMIEQVFQTATDAFNRYLNDHHLGILLNKCRLLESGPEYYTVLDPGEENIKQICINFENFYTIGRLLDIDVYQQNDKMEPVIIDRDALGLAPRQCLICEETAKDCTRNRTHSLMELRQKINQMCQHLI